MLSRLRELTVTWASTSRACLVDGGGAEQHARLGDVQAAQDVLDPAGPRERQAWRRSGLGMVLPSVVVGWPARGHRLADWEPARFTWRQAGHLTGHAVK